MVDEVEEVEELVLPAVQERVALPGDDEVVEEVGKLVVLRVDDLWSRRSESS